MSRPDASLTSPDVAAFVLAGGQSSRMGRDKALVLFAGIPLIQKALNILLAAAPYPRELPRIAGFRSDLSCYAESIPDTTVDVGPLGGIHAALSITQAEWNLFLPVDMPLMPASLLRLLIERAQITGETVTALKLSGRLEPYPVLLHRSVLTVLTARLRVGQTAGHLAWKAIPYELNSSLDAPSVENLVQAGEFKARRSGYNYVESTDLSLPPAFWFRSANTPADLALLSRLHGRVDENRDTSSKLNR